MQIDKTVDIVVWLKSAPKLISLIKASWGCEVVAGGLEMTWIHALLLLSLPFDGSGSSYTVFCAGISI